MKTFHCRCQLGKKNFKYSFKQNILNFPNILWCNFSKDEIFEEETLSSKNAAEFKDFTMPKRTSSEFFCQSNFISKEFYQQQSTVIYSRILCNIMWIIISALATYKCITTSRKWLIKMVWFFLDQTAKWLLTYWTRKRFIKH